MVQIKTSVSFVLAAAAIAPAVAYPLNADVQLEEREPRFGMGHVGRFMGMRHHHHGAGAAAAAAAQPADAPPSAREFDEELFQREPRIPAFSGRLPSPFPGGSPRRLNRPIIGREFDEELLQREPRVPAFSGRLPSPFPGGSPRRLNRPIIAREFDEELFQREPRVPAFSGRLPSPFPGGAPRRLNSNELFELNPNFGKAQIKESHLRAREFDDEVELMGREPFLGFNHIKNWINKKLHHNQDASANADAAPAAREYEDLLERELYDDLD